MKTLVSLILIALVCFLGCSSPNAPQTGGRGGQLTGVWGETFTQDVMKQITFPEDTDLTYQVTCLSRVTFTDSTFEIDVSVPADPHAGSYVQTGWYRVNGDTLTLIYGMSGDPAVTHERYYQFDLKTNELNLWCLAMKQENGMMAIELTGAFWELGPLFGGWYYNPGDKRSGTFTRPGYTRHFN
jgi:hypothetical protein